MEAAASSGQPPAGESAPPPSAAAQPSGSGSQQWEYGKVNRLKAAKKLKAMRALQATLGQDDALLADQLEQRIVATRRVAQGGRSLETQEEDATAALAEARVKLDICMNSMAQLSTAKERAETEI